MLANIVRGARTSRVARGFTSTAVARPLRIMSQFQRHQSTVVDSSKATNSTIPKRQVVVDREFPDPFEAKKKNRYYFVFYGVGVTLACLIVFNYEKTRSPVINSVLYCLRRSDLTRKELGPNINFKSSWPWIWGELNTMQGRVNIEFDIKGDLNEGTLFLKATRKSKMHPFDVHEWKLKIKGGPEIDLLKDPTVEFGL